MATRNAWSSPPVARDEAEQVAYLGELLDIVEAEGVDSAFVFAFEMRSCRTDQTATRDDLDRPSYGIVRVLEGGRGEIYSDMPWKAKAAFAALADHYGASS